ncbi:MAG: type II toxin-antitoxin system VapC family toxin [Deltaproteobacteria bacterium]|nr:type II toxin-antitoxin system VapC family toxin [Deltaproteobacteria bacterium]
MKRQIVVDSSVVVKWFDQKEPSASNAIRILEEFIEGKFEIIIPDLLFYEVGNVFLKKWPGESYKMKKGLQKLWRLPWLLMPLRDSLLSRTLEIADQCRITFYDSLFLVVAEYSGVELVTADEKFLKKVGNFSFAKSLERF